jgi:hypothetical protein
VVLKFVNVSLLEKLQNCLSKLAFSFAFIAQLIVRGSQKAPPLPGPLLHRWRRGRKTDLRLSIA